MSDHVRVLRNLLLPSSCVGCGQPHSWWCEECAARVWGGGIRVPLAGITLSSATRYEGVARDLVLGLKERRITALAAPLRQLLAAAVREHPAVDPDCVIVPVPGRRRSRLERGFDVSELLLAGPGPLSVARCLQWRRRSRTQKSLGRRDRAHNLVGALTCGPVPRRVIVVDDVVTTGATLSEAIRAVRCAGGEVVGAASVCFTTTAPGPGESMRSWSGGSG